MDGESTAQDEASRTRRPRRGRGRGGAAAQVEYPPARIETLRDQGPQTQRFLEDVLEGLSRQPPELPSKYLYDETGSRLFDAICELDVYYPTRTEQAILEKHAGEIARRIGPRALLIEFGSGSSVKTRVLLDHLRAPAGYVPIDISREHLVRSATALARAYPQLAVLPFCGDYTQVTDVPAPEAPIDRRVVFFPGSTIGNLSPAEAQSLLRRMAQITGSGGRLLIGVDLDKDARTLELAYDDPQGVTAAFELNVLERINRELGGDFDREHWSYRARYDSQSGCVEMSVVSERLQRVRIGGVQLRFAAGEGIVTERSHKYRIDAFEALARGAGLRSSAVWTDPAELFSVQLFSVP